MFFKTSELTQRKKTLLTTKKYFEKQNKFTEERFIILTSIMRKQRKIKIKEGKLEN